MQRRVFEKLAEWYHSADRKPLVLRGARQVGKTFAVTHFGRGIVTKKGGNYHYIDLKKEENLHSIFQDTNDPQKIIELIEVRKNIKIDVRKDLLFLDEIQECKGAISTLKYFEQEMKCFALIVAGSHLGLVNNEESFPVGKVNFMSMFPMTFEEFTIALEPNLLSYIKDFDPKTCQQIPTTIHERLLEVLVLYFAVGGLPEVVSRFIKEYGKNLNDALTVARQTQHELIMGYSSDFSKYAGTVNANHIHQVFDAIPKQLAKSYDEEVKKFKFSEVISRQKGFDRIIGPLTWLCNSRLSIKNFIANKSGHPLSSYTKENQFKVFFLDVGLLNAALSTPMEAIIKDNLSSYKGYIVENFVAQELYAQLDRELIAWKEGGSEIEFLVTCKDQIVPIEVKSSRRSRRAKSLDTYIRRYKPKWAYKLSGQNVGTSTRGYMTVPLYLISTLGSDFSD